MNRRANWKHGSAQDAEITIGDIYLMEFDGTGSEQAGLRPGVVFQNNVGNDHSPNIIALPITSSLKRANQPTHVVLAAGKHNGLTRDSMVLCENPQRMSKGRVYQKIGHLGSDAMRCIAIANALASSAIGFLSYAELMDTWKRAKKLNGFPS